MFNTTQNCIYSLNISGLFVTLILHDKLFEQQHHYLLLCSQEVVLYLNSGENVKFKWHNVLSFFYSYFFCLLDSTKKM